MHPFPPSPALHSIRPMNFTEELIASGILTAAVLTWANWANLDLGFRSPDLRRAWPWIAFFIAWIAAEQVVAGYYPVETDPDWQAALDQMPLGAYLAIAIVLGPIFEELLFRGAMFAAFIRRWGIWVAVIVPSTVWGLIHTQYELWFVVSITCSGVILAMIRWRSNSIYVPLALHAGYNLYDLFAWSSESTNSAVAFG